MLAVAGCAQQAPDGGVAPGPHAAEPDARDVVLQPIHIEGSTAAGACLAAAAQELCRYEMTATAFNDVRNARPALWLNGTLAWDAVSPTSQTLTLYVARVVDGQYVWAPGDAAASGTSPLSFELALGSTGGGEVAILVGNGAVTGLPTGYAAVQTPQAFVLDAVLTLG